MPGVICRSHAHVAQPMSAKPPEDHGRHYQSNDVSSGQCRAVHPWLEQNAELLLMVN